MHIGNRQRCVRRNHVTGTLRLNRRSVGVDSFSLVINPIQYLAGNHLAFVITVSRVVYQEWLHLGYGLRWDYSWTMETDLLPPLLAYAYR
jgi:hypothetical protein